MGIIRVCIAALALLALCRGAWGRPAEEAQAVGAAGAGAEAGGTVSGAGTGENATWAACPHPPTRLGSIQEISGDWCHLLIREDVMIDRNATCKRLSISSDDNRLRTVISEIRNGEITATTNLTFSEVADRSWEASDGTDRINVLLGFDSNEHTLVTCMVKARTELFREKVISMTLGRCLQPGEEAMEAMVVVEGLRPVVQRCSASPAGA